MLISYNWLSEYLPVGVEPEKLSSILTSVGLEVESLHKYESLKGGLAGIVTGEIVSAEKHPDADKLKITTVNIGTGQTLQIVCGAPNAAAGQKVLVATVGATLYPASGEPIHIKKARIRGAESFGMICAEDEIGLGESHAGIMVLPNNTEVGLPAAGLFTVYNDHIFEIGLTPNRMDAMSHLGVARDVLAWLQHHEGVTAGLKSPLTDFNIPGTEQPLTINVAPDADCPRYSGLSISGITIADSPVWLQNYLKTIGLKPINNIVDITNFVQHETGQPLHAFDADKIGGSRILVRRATAGEKFITLDNIERKLTEGDLVIANEKETMCIAGVYGGANSGVSGTTTNIFLESANFSAAAVRKTSVHHKLRTDAATRFEKGTDIEMTVPALKRAAALITEIAGGVISSGPVDIVSAIPQKRLITVSYRYFEKLSGKKYAPAAIKKILESLGFEIAALDDEGFIAAVPHSKTDMNFPADIVEEVMRIDGLDNIEIPAVISLAPGRGKNSESLRRKEKIAAILTGSGFHEIFTNSITDSKYFPAGERNGMVRMLNSLSADLDVMRPAMLQTGLESIAYNINRRQSDILFYEFGKTYGTAGTGNYIETSHLALFSAGVSRAGGWQQKDETANIWFLKGVCENIFRAAGVTIFETESSQDLHLSGAADFFAGKTRLARIGEVAAGTLKAFGIKEKVFFADIFWDNLAQASSANRIIFNGIAKFPVVERDLAMVIDKTIPYAHIEEAVRAAKISSLRSMRLFDVFENEKLGTDKVSVAVKFNFSDDHKTLEDSETDAMMKSIIKSLEKNFNAQIRS